jgi:5-deoxy-glucuronate isomerase
VSDPRDLHLKSHWPEATPASSIEVTVESAGWEFCSLNVLHLAAGQTWSGASGQNELGLVALGGCCRVRAGDQYWEIGGREHIFAGQPWGLYLPIGTDYEITALTTLELAICGARAEIAFPPRLITPDDVAVEIRGAGNAARQINHIIKPEFPAHRLLIVEVFTPSGNWSSYPPHKHDVSNMPAESDLEEIYYYRIHPSDGFGLQRLYTADGSIDQAYVIHDGDLLLVPEGYHAFAVAQGYTGYYLNVLAGNETVRTMQPADDPRYHWLRSTWNDEQNGGATSWREIDRWVNRGAGSRSQSS